MDKNLSKDNENEENGGRVLRSLRRRMSSDLTDSNENVSLTPKKAARLPKLKTITEKQKKRSPDGSFDDNDDASSASTELSTSSMRNCKVVLQHIPNDEEDASSRTPVRLTRGRKKSTLTEANLAAHSPLATRRRSTRAGSVLSNASDETGKSATLRTRASTRAGSNSNTPQKEPKTPIAKKTGSRLSKRFEKVDKIDEYLSDDTTILHTVPKTEINSPTSNQDELNLLSAIPEDPSKENNLEKSEVLVETPKYGNARNSSFDIGTEMEKISQASTGYASMVFDTTVNENESGNNQTIPTEERIWVNSPSQIVKRDSVEPMDVDESILINDSSCDSPHETEDSKTDEPAKETSVAKNQLETSITTHVAEDVVNSDLNSSSNMFSSFETNQIEDIQWLPSVAKSPKQPTPLKINGTPKTPLQKTPKSQKIDETVFDVVGSPKQMTPKSKTPSKSDIESSAKLMSSPKPTTPKVQTPLKLTNENLIEKKNSPKVKTPKLDTPISSSHVPSSIDVSQTPKTKTPKKKIPLPDLAQFLKSAGKKTPKVKTPVPSPKNSPKPISSDNALAEDEGAQSTQDDAFESAEEDLSSEKKQFWPPTNADLIAFEKLKSPKIATPLLKLTPKSDVSPNSSQFNRLKETLPMSPLASAILNPNGKRIETPNENGENLIEKKKASNSKKSVTLMGTPKQHENGESEKRIDTPYPDPNAIQNHSDSMDLLSDYSKRLESKKDTSLKEAHLKASRDQLRKLSDSWNQSIKSIVGTAFIDGLGATNKSSTDQVDETPVFITAVNRLENGNRSIENAPLNDHDVNDKEEEEEEEDEQNSANKNEFIDDEAEEVDENEDSMDEEERQYLKENEVIERGISLGSEDTDIDNSDDENEKDSFIASDDDVHGSSSSDEDVDRSLISRKKFKRILQNTMDSDDDSCDTDIQFKNKSLVELILNGSKKKNSISVDDTQFDEIITEENVENGETIVSNLHVSQHIVNTSMLNSPRAGRKSIQNNESVNDSVASLNKSKRKSLNKSVSGFIETDDVTADKSDVNASISSKNGNEMNSSKAFVEEDMVDEEQTMETSSNRSVRKSYGESKMANGTINSSNSDQVEADDIEKSTENDSHTSKSYSNVSSENSKETTNDDDENILYSFNRNHPQNIEFFNSMIINESATDASDTEEHLIESSVINKSANKLKTPKSCEKQKKIPEESVIETNLGKENITNNTLGINSQLLNRTISSAEDLHSSLIPLVKKLSRKSLGDLNPNQSIQVFPFTTNFDVNESNLRKSSTPNAKALKKVQKPIQSKLIIENDSENLAKIFENTSNNLNASANARQRTKSLTIQADSPKANNNIKDIKKASSETKKQSIDFTTIMNRCYTELAEDKKKKELSKADQLSADEKHLEKNEKKKQRKIEKLEARAAAKEKQQQHQELKELQKVVAEQKNEAHRKQTTESDGQKTIKPSTSSKQEVPIVGRTENRLHKSSKRAALHRNELPEPIQHHHEQTKQKKHKCLNILTASGQFKEEPMTPPKIQFGFKETPLTPINRNFQMQEISKKSLPTQNVITIKSKKRKLNDIQEPVTSLPKPKWCVTLTDNGSNPLETKRQRTEIKIISDGATEFIVKPFYKRQKQSAASLIPLEMLQFRQKHLNRDGIPRQDARTLLRQKEKMRANKRS